jgi:Tol biopolymer transport system component
MVHRHRRGLTRARPLLGALVLALLAFILPPVGTRAHTCDPDPQVGVSGRLVFPRASGLVALDLPDRVSHQLAVLPSVGVVTGLARSPDGGAFAVARFWRPPEHTVGGQDILIVSPDGGEPRGRIDRSQPGEVLGAPNWLPDGSLVFDRQSVAGVTVSSRIERAVPGGSETQLLADRGWAPTVSPDGASVAFIRSQDIDRLVIKPIAGGPELVLVDEPQFLSLSFPRFSPDGAWIAFAAASIPGAELQIPAAIGPSRPPNPEGSLLLRGLGGQAYAHGIPWDIWLVRPDGSELRRLTNFFDDDPSAAWSPDGRWVAVFSAEALHVVAVDGPANYCIAGEGGYGAIEWLP